MNAFALACPVTGPEHARKQRRGQRMLDRVITREYLVRRARLHFFTPDAGGEVFDAGEPDATAEELADLELLRPKTRGECAGVPRPCPFVSCRANLFLEVSETGGIGYNHGPGVDPMEVDPEWSCALDVAERGGVSPSEMARAFGVDRHSVRAEVREAMRSLPARAYRELVRKDGE